MSFFVPPPVGGKVTLAFLGGAHTNGFATSSSFTFSGLSFGTPSAARSIVCALQWVAGSVTVSSLTIGSVAATRLVSANGPLGDRGVALYIAAVPTGTSGNVTVSLSGAVNGCGVYLYSLLGATAAAATAASNAAAPTASLTVQGGGAIIATAQGGTSSVPTVSWSGLIDDADANPIGNQDTTAASAQFNNTTAVTVACTFTPVDARFSAGVFAVFNPA